MENKEEMELLRKELKISRMINVIVAILLVIVIAGGIYIVNMFQPTIQAVEDMQPIVEKLEDLDVEMLNEKLSQLDMEALTEALQNINDAATAIEEMQQEIEGFKDSISSMFSNPFGSLTPSI